jgi:hypothetical protein
MELFQLVNTDAICQMQMQRYYSIGQYVICPDGTFLTPDEFYCLVPIQLENFGFTPKMIEVILDEKEFRKTNAMVFDRLDLSRQKMSTIAKWLNLTLKELKWLKHHGYLEW